MNFRRLLTLFVMLAVPLLLVTAGRVAMAQAGEQGATGAAPAGETSVEPAGPVEITVNERSGLVQLSAMSQNLSQEVEPNNDFSQANPLGGDTAVVLGKIYPNADVDYYSFTAAAGDNVYAAIMTSGSSSGSVDSVLQVLDSDGTTVLEQDLDDGTFGSTSSSIAGTEIPAAGTYYLRVSHNSATSQLRPYHLHFRLQSGSPTAEVEPNDGIATAQPLPASGWIIGDLSTTADFDYYSLALNAGDTIYASLDLDPTRDNTQWNGQLGMAIFGGFILNVNDASTGSPTNPLSEAHFMTAKEAGTYYVRVNVPTGGTTVGDYTLSVTVHPAAAQSCTTYTSTDVPVVIPETTGMVSSTLNVPGNPTIGDLNVSLNITHTFMSDLDVALYSPAGNTNPLFTDIGSSTVGGPSIMDLILDNEAAIPPLFTVLEGMVYQPEFSYDLGWFDGEDAGGEWTLVIWDDANGDGGTLLGWGIEICEPAEELPMCDPGFVMSTVYSSDFESGDGGFTHSGTLDEWELGLPTATPITDCNSGSNCWKTDLDNTYENSSDQDLLSPAVDLSAYGNGVWVSWAQKYHMESASFDHAFAEVRQAGGGNEQKLWEWIGASMNSTMGNPSVSLMASGGWGTHTADISGYQGSQVELRFHVDSDSSVQYGGLAVDDVAVLACIPVGGDPDINVNPTSLSTTLEPDQQDTLALNISNLGGTDLTWNIVEVAAPVGATTLPTAPAVNPGILLSGPAGNVSPVAGRLDPSAVLYDQTDSASTASSSSQEFEVANAAFDNQAADDFVVPAGDVSWTIDTVFVLGAYFNGPGPMPFVNVYFYEDNGGLPGTEVASFDGLTSFTDAAGDLTIDLSASPVVLPAGTYWLSVQADMDFTPTGQWGWTDRVAQTGSPAAWRNPGNGFGTGCIDWAARAGVCGVGVDPDHLFQLGGTIGGGGGGCTVNDIPWASVSPSNGTTTPGATTSVDVTIDSTGLTPGVYTADLCVQSNDPDESELFVPLTLTVSAVGDPDIDVDPTSLASTLDPNQQDTQTLDISNVGGGSLDWNIVEQASARSLLVDVIADGSFEAGSPNPSWEEFSLNFGTPLCDFASCGADLAHTGSWFAWFGGTPTPETGYVSQTVTIPAGTATLSYWLLMGNGGNTGSLEVSIDGNVLVTYTEADTGNFADYTQVTHDVSAYADDGDHVVQFLSNTNAGAGSLNFFVDDVVLDVDSGGGGGCTPNDIPWASANPTAGSTPGGSTSSVDVTFDSTGLTPGVYEGDLCVESNDPDEPEVIVPLTLTVSEPADDPDIDVDPTSLSSTLPEGGQETQALDINNLGGATLDWTVIEQQGANPAVRAIRKGAVAVNTAAEPVVESPADCAQFANYAGREPEGYARFCTVPVLPTAGDARTMRDPSDIAYALDIGFVSDNFISHELGDFPGQTVHGANARPIFAMDFDETATTLYAIDNTTREFGTLDLSSGTFTTIAVVSGIPVADNISGLTIDPADGTAYVSAIGAFGMNLHTFDLATGVATLIGNEPSTPLMIDIAIGPQGVMYGHNIDNDSIYTIDTATGAATLVGPTGVLSNFAQGMDFDNEDGTLYAYTYQGGGAQSYGTIDLATGALTVLATTPQGEFEGASQTVMSGGGGCTANDIPWASVSPSNGSTPGGGTSTVNVTFDATGLTPGVYTADLCVESNDPDEPEVFVPLTLTVEEVSVDPDIDVDPTSLASTLPVDGQETQGLDISNLGGADLTWDVVEEEATAYTIPLFEGNLIQDGGFEAGTPNPYWTEYSLNFGTTLCDAACGLGGGSGPHSGAWWNWFGGITGVNEIGYTTQDVVIPAGTATLSFWLEIPVAGTTGFLNVEMDGDIIATYTEADAGAYFPYAQVTLDVSAYADGNSHTVEFYSETVAGADVLNFFVDDVELTVVAGGVSCDAPSDLPWVSVSPTNGTTAPGGTSTVDVTFDATGLTPGVYSGNLCIASNDPDEPEVLVPLALTVEEDVEPPVPQIMLVKTVGTNPAECADTDLLNVPAGTEVTYCYEMTNIGEVTVDTHDLTDSELGDLLTDHALDLAPGASFYVTATAVINVDTTNTAVWTAFAGDQQAMAQDSATVLVIEEGPDENLTFLPLMYKGGADDQPVSQNVAKPAGLLSLLFSLPFFGLVLRRK